MPAPAPWARTKQACARGGCISKPVTGPQASISIRTVSILVDHSAPVNGIIGSQHEAREASMAASLTHPAQKNLTFRRSAPQPLFLSSVAILSSRLFGAKRGLMRPLVQPPPSTRCSRCSGELRLKRFEPDNRPTESVKEIFVCANCGYELACVVAPDKYGRTHQFEAAAPALNQSVSSEALPRTWIPFRVK